MSAEKKQDINQLGKFRYPEIALANARIVELEAQIASAQQQEPVYQARMCVIGKKWGFWTDCNQSFYEQSGGLPVSGGIYQHEFRRLYAEPVISQQQLTDEQILADLSKEFHLPNDPGNELLQRVYPPFLVRAVRAILSNYESQK